MEALLVVTSGDSEDVALELFSHDFAIDFLAHSSIVEGTATKRVSGFDGAHAPIPRKREVRELESV